MIVSVVRNRLIGTMPKKRKIYQGIIQNQRKAHAAQQRRAAAAALAQHEEQVRAKLAEQKPAAPLEGYLHEKAPKLIGDKRIATIAKLPWLRSIDSWECKTKGREGQFISLCEHLFAKYPTPRFLWNCFDDNEPNFVNITLRIAKGESLYKICQAGQFPVKLTRKMCHIFLSSNGNLIHAIRSAQVLGLGGSPRLAREICSKTRIAHGFDGPNESFIENYLQWCVNNPMFPTDQIDPLYDYIIRQVRPERPNFMMTGRSAVALLREMERWHATLRAPGRRFTNNHIEPFKRSGFKDYFEDRSKKNKGIVEIWTIKEILTPKELHAEGFRMRHCVYSYARNIYSGQISIWSLGVKRNDGDYSVVTIELNNHTKTIVQARGPCNRMPEPSAREIIYSWAKHAGLICAV